eukprot:TRINITY_DN4774_c0_g1_i1.p1 TRINITY_DN4774_c0_g1~~TRINITY_DN4774_c0_g1_i1.p1  ORF type:complete len:232 (+),score=35.41 TRINITY_DN4774_c0_g1_i1:115-810(+)
MTSNESTSVPSQAPSHRGIGLSDVAEQRWLQMMGATCQSPLVFPELGSLSQRLGFTSLGRRPMHPEDENVVSHLSQNPPIHGVNASSAEAQQRTGDDLQASLEAANGDEAERTNGAGAQDASLSGGVRTRTVRVAHAYPTQQLLDDMFRNRDVVPLPPSFQSWAPFVPPADEEWHVLDGYYVRMSRAELDELLARADGSESEEDILSLADTSVGPGSDNQDERAEDSDSSF